MASQSEANDPHEANDFDLGAADLGPTDAEVDAWAQRERERREAWLRGPSQAQRLDWAARERTRRRVERGTRRGIVPKVSLGEDRLYLIQRYAREAQLAAEGAVSLMFSVSIRDMFDQLVQAGRDWEDEYTSRPARRRIPLEGERERGSTSAGESPGTTSPTS